MPSPPLDASVLATWRDWLETVAPLKALLIAHGCTPGEALLCISLNNLTNETAPPDDAWRD